MVSKNKISFLTLAKYKTHETPELSRKKAYTYIIEIVLLIKEGNPRETVCVINSYLSALFINSERWHLPPIHLA